MEKCKHFHVHPETKWYDYGRASETIYRTVCWGTKECENCTCQGDKSKCDFYEDVRKQAEKETLRHKLQEAVELLHKNGYEVYKVGGINND